MALLQEIKLIINRLKSEAMTAKLRKHNSCFSLEFEDGAQQWSLSGEPETAFLKRIHKMLREDIKKELKIKRV